MKQVFFLLWIMAFLPFVSQAQTRLYLATSPTISGTGPIVTPHSDWTVIWNNTKFAADMKTFSQYISESLLDKTLNANMDTVQTILIRRILTQPLAAQTLNGTFSGQVEIRTFGTGNQGYLRLRLVNPNGSVANEVGTRTTATFSGGANWTNRSLSITLSGVVITTGQRLLLEIGLKYGGANGGNVGMSIGNRPGFQDLPVDNTSNNLSYNPWFEFSQTIKFMPLGLKI